MNKQKVLKDFDNFIKIQSVSTDPGRFKQILEAVDFLGARLKKDGFRISSYEKKGFPPLIIASKIISDTAKTIGIYGHYDVQPEDPVDEWKTDPFKLIIKNSKMYGRGTADNKGHIIQNLTAIGNLISEKKLNNNIVFVLEGEEESGSVNFEDFIKEVNKTLSKVDVFYLTDVGMHWRNIPQIFYGLRGLIYFEIKVWIGGHDLHSGVYGNRVYNPAQILSGLFAKIKNVGTNEILIPGFYNKVRKPKIKELELLSKAKVDDKSLAREAKVYKVLTVDDYPAFLSSKIYPSFDINGIESGYTGHGSKTIIPRLASAKFSFRLIENQTADGIEKIVKDFVQANIPEGVKYKLQTNSKADPFYASIDNEFIQKTAQILEEVFGNKTLFNRSGGSVPAAEVLQRLCKKPVILTGFTLPDDNLHAPNENFDEAMFWKGITALERIYCM